MSILNRISTILRANINDLLDQAEDPEKTLNQILLDMREATADANRQVVDAMAQVKLVEGDRRQAQSIAAEWERKAEFAISRGADDLARECLRRKRDYDGNVGVYDQQIAALQQNAEKLRNELGLLKTKYEETQRNRSALIARYQAAQTRERIARASATVSLSDPSSALNRMEERIRLKEARSAAESELAAGSLDARLGALSGGDSDLEIEMEMLRLKSKGQPPQLSSGQS